MIVLAAEIEPRHFVVALPLAVTLGGGALGELISRREWRMRGRRRFRSDVASGRRGRVTPGGLPALRPDRLPRARRPAAAGAGAPQYVTDHSAGFGLREAVQAFPQTIGDPGAPVIASMFPDSCKRANFYAAPGYVMTCPPAPGTDAIQAALAEGGGEVYVLREAAPVGLSDDDLAALGRTQRLAAYPRPGETADSASVTLWRLTP